jgi:predicted kinase
MKSKPKGKIVLTVGMPGAGKSTYFARRNIHPLSTDTLRLWLLDDETDQSQQPLIFRTLRHLLRIRLLLGRPLNYIDATNLTREERSVYCRMAAQYNYRIEAIFFDIPLEICRQRNRNRARAVPEDAMEKMAAKLSPPALDEGFTRILVLGLEDEPIANSQ